jgi:hypothetical protein
MPSPSATRSGQPPNHALTLYLGDKVLPPLPNGHFEVAEESRLFIESSQEIVRLSWRLGERLAALAERPDEGDRLPSAARWQDADVDVNWLGQPMWFLQLTDFVGRNAFELEFADGSSQTLTIEVFPSKLSGQSNIAWERLAQMVGDISRLAAAFGLDSASQAALERLNPFEQHSAQQTAQPDKVGNSQALRQMLPLLRTLAPATATGATDGQWAFLGLPAREPTGLAHWITPSTAMATPTALVSPGHQATNHSRELTWLIDALVAQAPALAAEVAAWLRHTRLATPSPAWCLAFWQRWQRLGLDRAASPAQVNHNTLRFSQPARISSLYEIWAAFELAAALGCQHGEVSELQQDELSTTFSAHFSGPQAQVEYNARLSYRGLGSEERFRRPDVVVTLLENSEYEEEDIVIEVKYRNLSKLSQAAHKQIDDQLLIYKGLLSARVGLVIWPGNAYTERLNYNKIKRSITGKVSFAPGDSIHELKEHLMFMRAAVNS